ncbi:MAG TPA: nucleoside-diphosphate kinase [Verrucomicrobiae bacterium]|nr:nucleoside-diphosphate kinase [Verrucomicrobiae bacterium]
MEKTLIIFKPDAVARGIVGEILTRFEKVGLKIVGMKMLYPGREHYYEHYETIGTLKTRKGDEIFDATVTSMLEGPVIAAVLEGVEAIEVVRKMVGSTEPKGSAPGTVRADYAHMSYNHANTIGRAIPNIMHASADPEEAEREISHWFSESEIFDYASVHEAFTHGKRK